MSGVSSAKIVYSYDIRWVDEWSSIEAMIEQPGGIARLDVNDKRHQDFVLQSCSQLITRLLTSSDVWAEFIVKNVDRIEPNIFKETFNNAITEKPELVELIGTDSTEQAIKLLEILSPDNFERTFLLNKPLAQIIMNHTDKFTYDAVMGVFGRALDRDSNLAHLINPLNANKVIRLLNKLSFDQFKGIFLGNEPLVQFIVDNIDKFGSQNLEVGFSEALAENPKLIALINPLLNPKSRYKVIRLLNKLSFDQFKEIFLDNGELAQFIVDNIGKFGSQSLARGFRNALIENSDLIALIKPLLDLESDVKAIRLMGEFSFDQSKEIFLDNGPLAQFLVDNIDIFNSIPLSVGFSEALAENPKLIALINPLLNPKSRYKAIRLLNKLSSDQFKEIFLGNEPLAWFIMDNIVRFDACSLGKGVSLALAENFELIDLVNPLLNPKSAGKAMLLMKDLSSDQFKEIFLKKERVAQFIVDHADRFNIYGLTQGFKQALDEKPKLIDLINPSSDPESVGKTMLLMRGFLSDQFKVAFLCNERLARFIMDHADRFNADDLAKGFSAALAKNPELINFIESLLNLDFAGKAMLLMRGFSSDQFNAAFLRNDRLARFIMDHADSFDRRSLVVGFSGAVVRDPRLVRFINPEFADIAILLISQISSDQIKEIFLHYKRLVQFIMGHVDHQHIRRILKDFMEELFHDRAVLETISRQYGFAIFGDLLAIYGISREQFAAITPGDFAALTRLYDSVPRLTERVLATRGVSYDIIVPVEQRAELLRGIPEGAFPEEIQRIISRMERALFAGQTRLTKDQFAHLRMIADAMYNGSVNPSRNYGLDGEEAIAFQDAFFAVEPELRRGLRDYVGDLLVLVKLLEDSSFTQGLQPITAEEKRIVFHDLDIHIFRHCSAGWGGGIREKLREVAKKRGLIHGDATCEELKADFHYNFVEGKLREALSLRNLGVHSLHAIVDRYGKSLGFTDGEITTARVDPHHVSEFHFDKASTIFEDLRSSITPKEVATFFKEHIMAEAYSNERAMLLFQVCDDLKAKGMLPYNPDEFESHEYWLATFYTQDVKDISKFPDVLAHELCRKLGVMV